MELNQPYAPRRLRAFLLSGALVFVSALAYYILFRSQLPWPGYLLDLERAPLAHLGDISSGTYPSFAFALAMGLFSIALFNLNKTRVTIAIAGIWAIGIMHEISLGTFSQLDIAAGTVGSAIALAIVFSLKPVLTTKESKHDTRTNSRFNLTERLKLSALMVISATLATGTSEYEPTDSRDCITYDQNDTCIERRVEGRPVYLSYTDLRNAVKMSAPRELTSVSRIYLYGNMLFVNERNQGIHIIDNQFPTSPNRIGFIEIPGNTEISIRDNNLYADSYVDLVTLDLTNIQNITEIAREQSIFPYNSRQNIPDNVRLIGVVDSVNGVVVGYQ